jgi:transcriptional regulator with XRE-family HTH domain
MRIQNTEQVLKAVERLMKVAPSSSLERFAIRMRSRMNAMPMADILAKMPGDTITAKARALGVSRQTIHYWLNGETRPDDVQARKLEKLTGFSVAVIRGRVGDYRPA